MKFHIHTYGCQMNVRDSEAVAALLEAAGHERASGEADAELVIINSCTVRDMAERKALGKCGNLLAARDGRGRRRGTGPVRMVGLMGCVVKRLGEAVFEKLPQLDFAVGPRRFGLVPHLVAQCLSGARQVLELPGEDDVPDGLAAHPDRPADGADGVFRSYVTVLLGCDNRCSYCIVPSVRGHEYSRPAREIVAEVKALAARGVKEVCLLGQSVLRYGIRNAAWDETDAPSPGGYTEAFPRLLEALNAIPGLARIRFTSAHPKGCTDELVRAYRAFPKVCRHLHLPVQSGSDRLLAEMGRRYTRAEYLAAIAKLRAFDPDFAITTDIIVGYPGEREEDFAATRTLMEEAGFDNAFVFKYSPRPGTRSALLADDVPQEEKERRDQVLLADQEVRGAARNARLVGSVREVLAEGPSLRNASRWSGRDSGNRIVVFPPPPGLAPGDRLGVAIAAAHPQILVGEAVRLVLASVSPRRAKILAAHAPAFEVVKTDAHEVVYADRPQDTVLENAAAKCAVACEAMRARGRYRPDVLAADTIVWHEGRIFGKPRDADEAAVFLRTLSGRTHTVFTALAFASGAGDVRTQCVRSDVTLRTLGEETIAAYIARVNPLDRAGAYDIDACGDWIVSSYTGEYENIMGLPLAPLRAWGVVR